MKIGLLTFHAAHNYGAVLQAYATQEKVKELGFDIDIIDYNPSYLIKQNLLPLSFQNSFSINLKIAIESIITFPWKIKRRGNFQKFISQKMKLSQVKYQNHPFNLNNDYDLFIMGSDQIWNCKLTKGFDAVYLGNFSTKASAKKITYAASMSHYNLTSSQKIEFNKLLKNFNAISVREVELKELLEDEYDTKSTVVLDPTFLIDAKKWSSIAVFPRIKQKYVLAYSIDLREDALRMAHKIAKEIHAVVIELTVIVDKRVLKNGYQTASPEEYVGFFENAAFVVTSSFHGTAFSVIFNKPFYSIAHGSDKDSRQKTILENLGLLDRFILKNATPSFLELDYTLPNSRLETMREKSVQFLKNNLL
jgi:hypothetical protein